MPEACVRPIALAGGGALLLLIVGTGFLVWNARREKSVSVSATGRT